MGVIDFDEARFRHYLNKSEYISAVTITLKQVEETGKYSFFLKYHDDMDYETMQMFVMDVLEDLRENHKIETFEVKADDILNKPIRLGLFLPTDNKADYILYQYIYENTPDEDVDLNILAALLTNLVNNL